MGTDTFTYRLYSGTRSGNTAVVSIKVTGPCLDRDGDGFSPEGKSCGPVDCNDNDSRVTQCVATNACIDKLLASQVKISSARWDDEELSVAGSGATRGATVYVYDAGSNRLFGTTRVGDSGTWRLQREVDEPAPCRVRVEINGLTGQSVVAGAPSSCSVGAALACGQPESDSEEHDDD